MEPQISSTSIDENLALRYHATDQCQMNFSLQTFAKFCDSSILTQIFFKLLFAYFGITWPDYMPLCVRIGKIDQLEAPLNDSELTDRLTRRCNRSRMKRAEDSQFSVPVNNVPH